jgi:hypothetical protein
MTIWNVVLGVAVMLWAFGFATMKQQFSKRGRSGAEPQTGPDTA